MFTEIFRFRFFKFCQNQKNLKNPNLISNLKNQILKKPENMNLTSNVKTYGRSDPSCGTAQEKGEKRRAASLEPRGLPAAALLDVSLAVGKRIVAPIAHRCWVLKEKP